jgi:hypothetical protein
VLPHERPGLTDSVPREHVQNPVAPSQNVWSGHWASVEQRVFVRVGSGPRGFCGLDGTVDGAPVAEAEGVTPGFGDWARRATDAELSGLSFVATVAVLVVVAIGVDRGRVGGPGVALLSVRIRKKTNKPIPMSAVANSATTNTSAVRDEAALGGSGGPVSTCGWLG